MLIIQFKLFLPCSINDVIALGVVGFSVFSDGGARRVLVQDVNN